MPPPETEPHSHWTFNNFIQTNRNSLIVGSDLAHDSSYNSSFYLYSLSQATTSLSFVPLRLHILHIDRYRKEFVTSFSANHCAARRFVTKQSHCLLKHAGPTVKMPGS